jgi:hypothetical protein
MIRYAKRKLKYSLNENLQNEANPREIATCIENVGQKEDFMYSNFQMDIKYTMD